MKNLTLVLAVLFLFAIVEGKDRNKKQNKNNTNIEVIKTDSINISATDVDFFQNELRESVLEFIMDVGMNPDSCYVPFKK
jgi:hypothetical protein